MAIVGISASITRRSELAKEISAFESSNLTRDESACLFVAVPQFSDHVSECKAHLLSVAVTVTAGGAEG